MAYQSIVRLADLWDGALQPAQFGGQKLVLVRQGSEVFAYEDRCAHLGMPMSEGRLIDGVLICSAHLYEYDARTGRGINPRTVCLRRFPVKVHAGAVFVDMEGGTL